MFLGSGSCLSLSSVSHVVKGNLSLCTAVYSSSTQVQWGRTSRNEITWYGNQWSPDAEHWYMLHCTLSFLICSSCELIWLDNAESVLITLWSIHRLFVLLFIFGVMKFRGISFSCLIWFTILPHFCFLRPVLQFPGFQLFSYSFCLTSGFLFYSSPVKPLLPIHIPLLHHDERGRLSFSW